MDLDWALVLDLLASNRGDDLRPNDEAHPTPSEAREPKRYAFQRPAGRVREWRLELGLDSLFPPYFQESVSISRTMDTPFDDTGQPWLFHLNNSRSVTSPSPRYASCLNRAIDSRGLSPHRIHSLVGCPSTEKLTCLPSGQKHCRRRMSAFDWKRPSSHAMV